MRHRSQKIAPPHPSAPARARTLIGARADGFGIIELVIAMTIFSILIGGIVVSLGAGLALARNNRERSVASNLAAQEMDSIRQADFSSLTIGQSPDTTVQVDGVPFTVGRNLEWVGASATAGECDSATTTPQVLRVTVDVSWTNMKAIQPVRTTTILAPPIGSYDANSGHIAVRVRDSNAVPLGGVPVRVLGTGVDRTLTTTDANAASAGCAFFGFLPAQTYTVSLNTTSYVDLQGTASPSQTVGVTVGQVASLAFVYDRAATLNLTIAGINGGTPANAMAVSLGNTAYLPAGVKAFAGTGTSRTLTNLFPFNDGYDAWAGDCADADPEGKNASNVLYWPGASRDATLEVDPGTATSGTVDAASVLVNFTRTSGSGAVSVVAVHAADPKCTSGETLTVASFTVNASTTIALPYGTWTLQISGKTPVGSWPVVTLDPRVTTTATANVKITS
jgi:type II secretory pathway pseudopilin PulG